MILVIGHTKGGVGKSTLAWNIAHSLYRANKKVKIVDLDFQQTLYFINTINKESQIEILQPQTADELLELCDNHDGYLVIDLGGFDSDINRLALSKADKIVVPVSSSATEIIGFQTFKDILKDVKAKEINIVLNNIHHRLKEFSNIEQIVQNENMKLLKTVIRNRSIYKDSLGFGKSVFDTGNKQAIEEIEGLRDELIN